LTTTTHARSAQKVMLVEVAAVAELVAVVAVVLLSVEAVVAAGPEAAVAGAELPAADVLAPRKAHTPTPP
tara:strand:+ start:1003 stop:1212 length:210 start_codon:yes stop_codon:yes gene_type:complete